MGQDALTMTYVLEHLGYGCRDSGLLLRSGDPDRQRWRSRSSKFGSDELKERYLRRLIDGSIIGAHAISEPDAGSDATGMATTATEDGDSYVLNGKKAFCTSGPVADVITVYANRRMRRPVPPASPRSSSRPTRPASASASRSRRWG